MHNFIRPFWLCILWIAIPTGVVLSQVTIGSSEKSVEGTLLQLKNIDGIIDGAANSTKGLLLPRVTLNTVKPEIGKLSESIGSSGVWVDQKHTGLMVYNVSNTFDICKSGAYPGAYVWNGEEWLGLFQKKNEIPTTDVSTDEFSGANSYILNTNSSLNIPIKRAFDIWNTYAGSDANAATGKVLNKTNVNNLSGNLTVKIAWGASTISSATISGNGNTALLEIKSGNEGNGLVQVLIDGKVLWQWHIWVTNNNLANKAKLYRKNGIEEWHMDRFLGANKDTDGGLFYQWGRSIPLSKSGNIEILPASNSEAENLANAIQSGKFIDYSSTDSHDWYSSSKKQWDSRWGDSTSSQSKKSPFDPCPYGWRVPSASSDGTPWECIEKADEDVRGVLPQSGYLSNGDGSLGDVGVAGYVWSASSLASMAATLFYNDLKIDNWASFNRANAMNVRCVKEQ